MSCSRARFHKRLVQSKHECLCTSVFSVNSNYRHFSCCTSENPSGFTIISHPRSRFPASCPPTVQKWPNLANTNIRHFWPPSKNKIIFCHPHFCCSERSRLCSSLGLTTHLLWAIFLTHPLYLPFPVLSRLSAFAAFPAFPPLTTSPALHTAFHALSHQTGRYFRRNR